jgi:hypothetical protein
MLMTLDYVGLFPFVSGNPWCGSPPAADSLSYVAKLGAERIQSHFRCQGGPEGQEGFAYQYRSMAATAACSSGIRSFLTA